VGGAPWEVLVGGAPVGGARGFMGVGGAWRRKAVGSKDYFYSGEHSGWFHVVRSITRAGLDG
jgi:hypothetical protein